MFNDIRISLFFSRIIYKGYEEGVLMGIVYEWLLEFMILGFIIGILINIMAQSLK